MHHQKMKREYILTAEAATLLGLTPNSVRLMARRGELPALRVGTVRLFDRRVVQRLAQVRAQRHLAPRDPISAGV
jgi:excisionase family DNA binding protein